MEGRALTVIIRLRDMEGGSCIHILCQITVSLLSIVLAFILVLLVAIVNNLQILLTSYSIALHLFDVGQNYGGGTRPAGEDHNFSDLKRHTFFY